MEHQQIARKLFKQTICVRGTQRSLAELEKYAHREQRVSSLLKEAHSARPMGKRMVSADEMNLSYSLIWSLGKVAYLRQKTGTH